MINWNQRTDRFLQNLNGYRRRTTANREARVLLPHPKSLTSHRLWTPCSFWAWWTRRLHRRCLCLHRDHRQRCRCGHHNSVESRWAHTTADAIAILNIGQPPSGSWTIVDKFSTTTSSSTFSHHSHEILTSVPLGKVSRRWNLEARSEIWTRRILEFRTFNYNIVRRYQDGLTRGVLSARTGDNTIFGGKPPWLYTDKYCFFYVMYSWYTMLITNIKRFLSLPDVFIQVIIIVYDCYSITVIID